MDGRSLLALTAFQLLLTAGGALAERNPIGNCTTKVHLPCELYGTTDCGSGPAYLLNMSRLWPGPPRDLKEHFFYKPYRNKKLPGLNLTWYLPNTSSLLDVKGFEVKLYQLNGRNAGKVICRLLDFSNAEWQVSDMSMQMSVNIWALSSSVSYYVMVYSLPKPLLQHDKYASVFIMTPPSITIGKNHDPGNWRSYISWVYTSIKNQLLIEFDPAPENFNFTKYRVQVFRDCKANLFDKRFSKFENSLTVENICPGNYCITAEPIDPWSFQQGKCLCYTTDIDGKMCVSCVMTQTATFELKGADCITTSTKEEAETTDTRRDTETSSSVVVQKSTKKQKIMHSLPEEDNVVMILAIMFATVVGIILSGLFLFLKYNRRKSFCLKPHSSEVLDSNKNNNKGMKALPKLLMIYSQDHEAHEKVVSCLAMHLQVNFKCTVYYAPWCINDIRSEGTSKWLLRMINDANFVVIVNSEGAYKQFTAWKTGHEYAKFKSNPLGNMCLPALAQIQSQYLQQNHQKQLMCQMHYTNEKFLLSDYIKGGEYRLLKQFSDLVCYIHGLNSPNEFKSTPQINVLLNADHTTTPAGKALIDAIEEATEFQNNNPNWFSEMYGSPTAHEGLRHNSGDSGMDSLTVDSVENWRMNYANDFINMPCSHVDDFSFIPPTEYESVNDYHNNPDELTCICSGQSDLVSLNLTEEIKALNERNEYFQSHQENDSEFYIDFQDCTSLGHQSV